MAAISVYMVLIAFTIFADVLRSSISFNLFLWFSTLELMPAKMSSTSAGVVSLSIGTYPGYGVISVSSPFTLCYF